MALFQVIHGSVWHGGKLVPGDRFEGDPAALAALIQRGTIAVVDDNLTEPNVPPSSPAPSTIVPVFPQVTELININQAAKTKLRSLPHVGVAKAAQILERVSTGEFFTEQSLKDFLGLPETDWETLRSLITF